MIPQRSIITLLVMALAGIATLLALSHRQTTRLRQQNQGLESTFEGSAAAAADHAPLDEPGAEANAPTTPASDPQSDLLRLRQTAETLRQGKAEAKRLGVENARLRAASAAGDWRAALPPDQLIHSYGWGSNACREIAGYYSEVWLDQIADTRMLTKLGQALYDAGKYSDALAVFRKLELDQDSRGVALVWQGHMLDLLNRRAEALDAYQRAVGLDLDMRHDQYKLHLTPEYLDQRLQAPFTRVENGWED